MGRPAIVPFASFTEVIALEGAVSVLKGEKSTTIAEVSERLRKRVKDVADEALFVAKVRAALDTLVSQGKITIAGEAVSVVAGKRGRPRKVVAEGEATA